MTDKQGRRSGIGSTSVTSGGESLPVAQVVGSSEETGNWTMGPGEVAIGTIRRADGSRLLLIYSAGVTTVWEMRSGEYLHDALFQGKTLQESCEWAAERYAHPVWDFQPAGEWPRVETVAVKVVRKMKGGAR